MKKILMNRSLSRKILMVSVTYKEKGPSGGGVSSVIQSYSLYIDGLRHIASWKPGGKLKKIWTAASSLLEFLCLLLFDRRIKIVHVHTAAWASFERKSLFIRLAHRFGKKVIIHMHAADFVPYYEQSNHPKRILETLYMADKMIVLSKSWYDYFASIGVKKERLEILNNIVSEPENCPVTKDDNVLKLLYLGELSNRKGVFDLLNAVIANKEKYDGKVQIRLGGNGNEEKISKIISDNQLENIVKLEGWVVGEKKTICLNWADVYILPSYNEGLPIGILESMSYSHPIISTTVGGIPEVLFDGVNGRLIHPGNIGEIADAINTYLENPALIEKHGKESFRIVQAFFPEQVFGHLIKIYKELL